MRVVQRRDVDPLDPVGVALLLPPARHPPGQVAADPGDADRRRKQRGADAVLVVAPDQDDLLARGRRPRKAWCRSPPARRGSTPSPAGAPRRTGARCARRRPAPRAACFCSTWRGVSGCASTPSRSSGPRLMSTTAWKLGGCGGSDAVARATKRSSSLSCSRSLWRRSKPIVEETFMSIPGPPQSEPPRWPGQTSTPSSSDRSRSCSEWKIAARPLLLVDRQVGPRDVADEQRVAGEHRPRLRRRARCRSARRRCARAGGPACALRGRSTDPSASSQPSSNGSWS